MKRLALGDGVVIARLAWLYVGAFAALLYACHRQGIHQHIRLIPTAYSTYGTTEHNTITWRVLP